MREYCFSALNFLIFVDILLFGAVLFTIFYNIKCAFCAFIMLEFLLEYKQLFFALAWGSLVLFVVSLVAIPWLITKIPVDYFHEQRRVTPSAKGRYFLLAQLLAGIKNVLGFALVLSGVLMLMLPGQGVLTILIGLFLMDFPGKYTLERKLVCMPKVQRSLNWIRAKANKEPFNI